MPVHATSLADTCLVLSSARRFRSFPGDRSGPDSLGPPGRKHPKDFGPGMFRTRKLRSSKGNGVHLPQKRAWLTGTAAKAAQSRPGVSTGAAGSEPNWEANKPMFGTGKPKGNPVVHFCPFVGEGSPTKIDLDLQTYLKFLPPLSIGWFLQFVPCFLGWSSFLDLEQFLEACGLSGPNMTYSSRNGVQKRPQRPAKQAQKPANERKFEKVLV